MLKKIFAILFTITALLALTACELFLPAKNNDEFVTFDVSDFTKVESEVDTTVDTIKVASSEITTEIQSSLSDDFAEEMVIPAPIVAKWGNKTVTMEFKCVTDILYEGYFGCSHFQNGYAQFNDIGNVDCPIDISDYNGVNFNYMDYEGNRLFDHGFESTSSFDENGLAVAKKHDGTYVLISNDGSEKGVITKDEYDAFRAKLSPWSTPHYAKYYGDDSAYENYGIIRRGNLYEGLIPVLKRSDPQRYDTYLGLVDLNGNIVIEPTFGIYYSNRPIYLTEGYIAVNYQNRVSVIKVTIEGEDDNADTLYPDEVVLPEPIIAQWEDKTITIEYETVTDIILPYDTPTYYVNGYARIFECGNVDSPIDGKDVGYGTYYNYIDSKGNRLFEYGFKKATHFNENGIAYAQMLDGTYVCIGNDGTVRETVSSENFDEFERRMESYAPSIASNEYESKLKESMPEGMRVMHCGNEQDGLIPIIISIEVPDEIYGTDFVRKLGFADTEGNIIVQPDTIKAYGVLNGTFWNEGKMIIDYNNRLAILNVTVLPQ